MKQDYILQPDQFCKQNKLSAPYVFVNSSEGKKLYSNLATMASLPYVLFETYLFKFLFIFFSKLSAFKRVA